MLQIHPSEIPDGVDYQLIATAVCGDTRFSQRAEMEKAGWRAVPRDRHPLLARQSVSLKEIEAGGLLLVERPKYLTERARAWEAAKAKQQVSGGNAADVKRRKTIREFFVLSVWRLKAWWRDRKAA